MWDELLCFKIINGSVLSFNKEIFFLFQESDIFLWMINYFNADFIPKKQTFIFFYNFSFSKKCNFASEEQSFRIKIAIIWTEENRTLYVPVEYRIRHQLHFYHNIHVWLTAAGKLQRKSFLLIAGEEVAAGWRAQTVHAHTPIARRYFALGGVSPTCRSMSLICIAPSQRDKGARVPPPGCVLFQPLEMNAFIR